ncbi:hypothetical protein Poli38472_004761 [Pythium oligandrum]|uniref:Uncharacterized protein n=1 Tax=Pythium oligandrum TaxID=41045 RepID=A0A8K1CAP9_PYTOL|nr:hypothetical protein Poli38472_004761 [Pythium oligandrum]|eukprot:TMW59692.1 hypothetical protein Poli38472_004761 [Pythium oligandrum]
MAISTSITTALFCWMLALTIGYPVPFLMILGTPSVIVTVITVIYVFHREEIRNTPNTMGMLRPYLVVLGCQVFMTLVYPLYNDIFAGLTSAEQTGFVFLLPLIKVACKYWIDRSLTDTQDGRTEAIIFKIEVFHALFVAYCMQSSISTRTILLLILIDLVHGAISFVERTPKPMAKRVKPTTVSDASSRRLFASSACPSFQRSPSKWNILEAYTRVIPGDPKCLTQAGIGPPIVVLEDAYREAALRIEVPRRWFQCIWIIDVMLHFLNFLCMALFTAFYTAMYLIRGGYFLEATGIQRSLHIPTVILAYGACAVYFCLQFCSAVTCSIRHRRLMFAGNVFNFRRKQNTIPRASLAQRLRRWSPFLARMVAKIVYCWEVMSGQHTDDRWFEVAFLFREVLEVVLQSYQAYKCSTLLSQVWITDFYSGVLITNCWISPLIHITGRTGPGKKRFLYIWSDIVLDFVSTLVVPLLIILTLLRVALEKAVDTTNGAIEYSFDVPYDDVFLMNLSKGSRQICALNWFDFVSKLLPIVSMAACLAQVESLVVHRDGARPQFLKDIRPPPLKRVMSSSALLAAAAIAPLRRRSSSSLVLLSQQDTASTSASSTRSPVKPPSRIIEEKTKPKGHGHSGAFTHLVFVAWGFAILVTHYRARHSNAVAPAEARFGCKSSSQPWFVDQYSCITLEINCYRRNLTGSADEIDAALRRVHADGLSSLIISHCPALYIPPRIQTLTNLIGLEITNATLMEWNNYAALHTVYHPSLQFVGLIRVNMSRLPDGLQGAEFPAGVRDMTLVACNLTTLPDGLEDKWNRLFNLYLERMLLREIPPSVAAMRVDRLSLMANQIEVIPDHLLAGNRLSVLSVAKNPIRKLPSSIGNAKNLNLLLMDYTSIDELPQWLLDEGDRRVWIQSSITVSAGGSAYCLTKAPRLAPSGLKVVCRLKMEEEIEAYPMSFSLVNRAV